MSASVVSLVMLFALQLVSVCYSHFMLYILIITVCDFIIVNLSELQIFF